MNEKRFECVFKEHETNNCWSMIKDNQLDKPFYIKDVVALLNEQQDTIKYLTIEKHQENKRFQTIIAELKKENEQLKEEIEPLKQKEEVLNKIWRTYLENHK